MERIVILSIFLIVLLKRAPNVDGGIEDLELPESPLNSSSILCIIKLCQKYFRSEKRVIGSLVIVNVQNTTEFHSRLITMLNEDADYDMGVMIKDATKKHGNPAHVVDKAKNYFVVCDRMSEVMDALNMWKKLPTWNPLAQLVIAFINTYDDDDLLAQMQMILQQCLDRKMINVNVISYRINANIVQTHTFYPYDGDNCASEVIKLHMIEECEYSDETPNEPNIKLVDSLRPKIPTNLHGCELYIASSVLEPFVFYEQETNSFDIGTEVSMARTIAQALRMKPVFIRINETRENRVISNKTGIYALLLSEKADILIGGMDNDARVQKLLWISIPYIQDDQTWCLAIARPQELWRNIFGIYTVGTWSILIGAIFFNGFIIYLLIRVENRKDNYVWTLMIGMASALGQYSPYEPHRISIRVMMVFLFMYGLIMSSSFNSFLISILTRPKFKQQIDSLEMAIESGATFTGGELALSHYLGHDTISNEVRKRFGICDEIENCISRLENDVKLAVAVSRLHAMNTPIISPSQLYCFPRTRNIYSYSIAMPIKSDFHLMPFINYYIRQLFEFGLIERWHILSQSIAANDEIKKILNTATNGKDDRLVVLTVAHIMGAILIMTFGHTLALIAFLSEILTEKHIRKPNCGRFWKIVNTFLTPKRQ